MRHIRQFRPEIVVTHDAYGQLTGNRHRHRATILGFAAGLEHLYPDTGQPWQPAALYAAPPLRPRRPGPRPHRRENHQARSQNSPTCDSRPDMKIAICS